MSDQPPGQGPYTPLPRGLVILSAVIALIEIVLSLADRGILFDPGLRLQAFALGAFWSGLLHAELRPIYSAQPVAMFFTHALLHGGFLHMAMNTAILLALGRFVEGAYTPKAILPLFFAGALGGGAAYGLLSSGPYPMVGASGAVFAFLGIWVTWDWRRHRRAHVSVRPIVVRVLALAGLNLVFFFGLDGMLAWQAHLGGFLVGVLAGWLMENRRDTLARRRWRRDPDGR